MPRGESVKVHKVKVDQSSSLSFILFFRAVELPFKLIRGANEGLETFQSVRIHTSREMCDRSEHTFHEHIEMERPSLPAEPPIARTDPY
jgi:hypothetical protein